MADNVESDPGSGGVTWGTDEIAAVHYARTKVVWGPDGTVNDTDVASGKPLPIQLREADGTDVAISAKLGSLTEGAPATDTASSGINGRLQRIAQRLSSLIGLLPTALTAGGRLKISIEEQAAAVTVSDGGGSITVDGAVTTSGTVTANAGTNLNTASLALEAGGNLAAAATSLAIMDDWDESDRAKVNLIVGQAGVAAGNGVTGATVQRVVLANAHGKTIKKAVVSLSASGNIVAAAGASKSIRVFDITIQSRNDSMTIQMTDGSGGAALGIRWGFNAREGTARTVSPPAWLTNTSDNTALYATITGTGTIDIGVTYWDDDAA